MALFFFLISKKIWSLKKIHNYEKNFCELFKIRKSNIKNIFVLRDVWLIIKKIHGVKGARLENRLGDTCILGYGCQSNLLLFNNNIYWIFLPENDQFGGLELLTKNRFWLHLYPIGLKAKNKKYTWLILFIKLKTRLGLLSLMLSTIHQALMFIPIPCCDRINITSYTRRTGYCRSVRIFASIRFISSHSQYPFMSKL